MCYNIIYINCSETLIPNSKKNVKLTHNSTPEGTSKVCDMILFIGGPVDWEGGPVDWRAWETGWGTLDTVGEVA